MTQEAEQQIMPSPAGDGADRFLLAWQDDRNGGWDIYAQPFQPLQAGFIASPTAGLPPLGVVFTDTSGPSGTADQWQWDFGDGGTSTAQHPVYTYTQAGVYTVTLTVPVSVTAETDTLIRTSYIQVESPLQTTVISYEYDDLYRLTHADYTGAISATYDYAYDSVGNMRAFTETVTGTRSVERTFDGANQLITSFDDGAGTTSYTYDGNGNLTDVYPPGSDAQNPAGALQYDYDQRNMLITHTTYVSGTGWVLQAAYVYDGANDRLQQVDHTLGTAVTTTYTNDAVGLTEVLVADDGANQVYNLFGLDLISQDGGSEVRTLLADGLGSVRLELASGAVEAVTTYSPYGEVLEQNGTSGTVYGFTGEQEDSATGLLYLRARYYSRSLKVFQSRDPWQGTGWRPATLNYHVYAQGNPVNYMDPSGNCIVEWSGEVRMSEYPYGTSGLCTHAVPDWWNEGDDVTVYVESYGLFDTGHILRAYDSARWLMGETRRTLARGGGKFDTPASSTSELLWVPDYLVDYEVSASVTPGQLEGVVYGIYRDFELGYEEFQGEQGFPVNLSSFHPEDLPSDHIGFWAYVNGLSTDEIPGILESLGEVSEWQGLPLPMDTVMGGMSGLPIIVCFPRNRQFLPMVDNTYEHGLTIETRWQNRPWPKWLEITPIPSGPDTWQRVD